jgi:heterodisulfide reductase subunit A
VTFAKQLSRKTIGVNKSALVIGGGISGMTAALELADMGYKVHIAESSERLGGNAVKLGYSNLGRPVSPYVKMMIDKAQSHSNISIYFNAKVKDIAGYVGNFTANIKTADDLFEIEMGAIIVAVGANEHKPKEYLYGEDSRVITQMDLEAESAKNFAALKDVKRLVMIQCVGSREFCSEGGRAYCSRVCCSQAVKNSLLLKKKYPNLDITILYRDIRTYGMNELMYREARQAGVSFILYEEADKPVVQSQNGHLSVQVYEPIINACTIIDCDCLVLSTAIIPNKDNIGLGQILKVPTNQDGFFLEAHVKLRPVDFATEGIYICGLAHAPKNMKESIIQGKAAAGRAATIISKDKLETEGAIASSTVISYCAACGDCEKVCAYNAVQVAEVLYKGKMVRRAVVNEVLCKGCGTCTAVCRPGAIDMNGFSDKQILTEIEYLLRKAN